MTAKVTAADVLASLKQRHKDDVFVPECNTGSAYAGCRRMDAWAMKKSWVPLRTIGYEIKVTRSDFMNDDKWHEYLKHVHELWFACPWGLIQPGELPAGIGLLWLNKGGKLQRKRKAVLQKKREDGIIKTMAYILMSRAQIARPVFGGGVQETALTEDDWAAWLKSEGDGVDRDCEAPVSLRLLVEDELKSRVGKVMTENLERKCASDRYEKLEEKLREIGLDPDHLQSWNIQTKIDEIRGIADPRTIRQIRNLGTELENIAVQFEELRRDDVKS